MVDELTLPRNTASVTRYVRLGVDFVRAILATMTRNMHYDDVGNLREVSDSGLHPAPPPSSFKHQ